MDKAFDMTGIDDNPPEMVAHFTAEEIAYALDKCALKSSDQWVLRQAIRILKEYPNG